MKIFKFVMVALVVMCGLNSCSDDCDHDFIEVDYSKDIVGTWTYLAENGQAEAMVIEEDASFTITGISGNGSMYEEKGTIKVVNNKVTLAYEGGDKFDGRLELVAGKTLSIVFNKEYDVCLTYDYCPNDLSDEILGMWVCNETPTPVDNDMLIINYKADGTTLFSGYFYEARDFWVNAEGNYKVIGDLLFHMQPDHALETGVAPYSAMKLIYVPNANLYGDMMYLLANARVGENYVPATTTWLRVKQHLDLPGTKYDYTKTFVSNAKGMDKDIPFLNTSFNFAKMDGSIIDKFLKSTLFSVEFPGADKIKYSFLLDDKITSMTAPIEVDGNKMIIKMSANNPAYQDVEIFAFQDQDNTQMHLFMPTTSFEKFFANTAVTFMLGNGQLDKNDTEAIADVYQAIADAVESINLSLVMYSSK